MSRLFITIAAALALAGTLPAGAETATFGYTNGNQGKSYVFSNNTSDSGLALRLNPGKTALLKGRSITGLRVSFGSRNTTDSQAVIFLTKELGGTPLRTATVTIDKANTWLDFNFDQPYAIGADEGDLYIGYTLSTGVNTNYKPLSADLSDDIDDIAYIFNGTSWSDMYGSDRGMPNIYAILDSHVDFADILVKPFSGTGSYMHPGEGDKVMATVYNLGSQAITSLEGTISCRGTETALKLDNLSIAHGSDYTFPLPSGYDTQTGVSGISMRIDRLNGGADADPADNSTDAKVCFYPADNERGIMLDFFTGQGCSQCPGGHNTLHSVLSSLDTSDEVFYVAHHAGYAADQLTSNMAADLTALYPGTSTYAPAVSVCRTPNENGNIVANISTSDIQKRISAAQASEPFVSLDVSTAIDPVTREFKMDANVYCFKEIDGAQTAFNAFLVQDGITALQINGGNEYRHDCVDRIPLFGTWGKECVLQEGKTTSFSTTCTIPERIQSDFWTEKTIGKVSSMPSVENAGDATFDAPLENMRLVVYVARHDPKRYDGFAVVNAAQVKLGDSKRQKGFPENSGVNDLTADKTGCDISIVDGMIQVSGDMASVHAYTLDGRQLDVDSRLNAGIYVVRAIDRTGNATVKKFIVR